MMRPSKTLPAGIDIDYLATLMGRLRRVERSIDEALQGRKILVENGGHCKVWEIEELANLRKHSNWLKRTITLLTESQRT